MHQAGAQLSCRRGSLSGGAGEIFGDRGAWGFLRFFSFLISSENRNKSFCSSLRNP